MRPPQTAGVAKQSDPSWLSATTLNSSGFALKTNVRPDSLVAKTWSPTRTGDEVKLPPSRPVHTCLPVSLFQQAAVPASRTAYRCPSRANIDGTYTRLLLSHAILPDP